LVSKGCLFSFGRGEQDTSRFAVHQQAHAGLNMRSNVNNASHSRDTQGTGNNGGVAENASAFGNDCGHTRLCQFDDFRR